MGIKKKPPTPETRNISKMETSNRCLISEVKEFQQTGLLKLYKVMKLKSKLSFSKSIATIIGLICIAVSCFIFQGCEKDDFLDENTTKENILQLAEKYGLNINFDTENKGNISNVESFKELELEFQKIYEQRKNDAIMIIKLNESIGDKVIASTINNNLQNGISLSRLKSGSNESTSSWFYDLTWYNVSVTYNNNGGSIGNVSVNGTYTGLSLYSYTQTSSTSSVQDGIISFQTYGYETHEWSIMGVSFSETRSIQTSGSYNTYTGKGSVNLSGNGYWFH